MRWLGSGASWAREKCTIAKGVQEAWAHQRSKVALLGRVRGDRDRGEVAIGTSFFFFFFLHTHRLSGSKAPLAQATAVGANHCSNLRLLRWVQ